jgi:hypothetical protein
MKAPEAEADATTLTLLLQDLHFAARALEERFRPDPQDRLSDRVHAARVLAERLRRSLGA